MGNIKTFEEFAKSQSQSLTVYTTSHLPISKIDDRPMWFSLTNDDANMYHQLSLEASGTAYTYRFEIQVSIADDTDLEKWLDDPFEFNNEMVSNPTSKNVKNNPDIQLLQDREFDAVYLSDYHPIDNQRDIRSLLVFNPSRTVQLYSLLLKN